jgi:hypothetical protein
MLTRSMDPIIWAAIIAGGVSLIGNITTIVIGLSGQETLRKEISTTANVESAKVEAEAERLHDERREQARRERQELYARFLSIIGRLQGYGGDEPAPTDEEFDRANREFEALHSEILLAGTEAVQQQAGNVLAAFNRVVAQMHRFDGGSAVRFRAAYREHDPEVARLGRDLTQRGHAVAAAKAGLLWAMRADVTAPNLPEQYGGLPPDAR